MVKEYDELLGRMNLDGLFFEKIKNKIVSLF